MKWRELARFVVQSNEGHKILKRQNYYCCFAPDGKFMGVAESKDQINVILQNGNNKHK